MQKNMVGACRPPASAGYTDDTTCANVSWELPDCRLEVVHELPAHMHAHAEISCMLSMQEEPPASDELPCERELPSTCMDARAAPRHANCSRLVESWNKPWRHELPLEPIASLAPGYRPREECHGCCPRAGADRHYKHANQHGMPKATEIISGARGLHVRWSARPISEVQMCLKTLVRSCKARHDMPHTIIAYL